MPLPFWPIASFQPVPDSFAPIRRMLDSISTDMEGGNTRERPRPGDNVGTIMQTIWMSMAEHDTFVDWVKTTLNNGTARFTTNVWLGSSYVNKVCQFVQPGTKLSYAYLSVDRVAATMTLRVYDV
jgi:hypothetical protein